MRKIIIALIASTGVLSGCSDFLGTDPDNRTYIDTPEKVSALLVSAYPSSTFYSVVDARCDGFVDYGTAIAGVNSLFTYQEDAFRWREYSLAGEGAWDGYEPYWSAAYEAVAAANHALEAIDELEKTHGQTTQLEHSRGEALLCRAYAHFCLLSLYSDFFDLDNMASNRHPLRHRSREDDLCRILARNRRRNAFESAPGSRRRHENRRQRERLQRAEVPLHAPVGPGLRNPRGALHARLSERSILRQPVLPHAEPLRQTRHFEHDHQDACPVPLGERSLPHLLPQLSHRLEQDKHLQRQLRQDRSGVRVGRQQREPCCSANR